MTSKIDNDIVQLLIDAVNKAIEKAENTHNESIETRIKVENNQQQQLQILDAVKDMHKEQKRMNDILSDNTSSLNIHIKRTNILEKEIGKLDNRVQPLETEYVERKAVKGHRKSILMKVFYTTAILSAVTGIIFAIVNYLI